MKHGPSANGNITRADFGDFEESAPQLVTQRIAPVPTAVPVPGAAPLPGGRRAARLAGRGNGGGNNGFGGGTGTPGNVGTGPAANPAPRRRGALQAALGIIAEILLTLAAICALYIVWQMWWTGVQAEHTQMETRQSVDWADPTANSGNNGVKIAAAQSGEPPVQTEKASEGELLAQVYIPRFGDNWERNMVQGTTLEELNKHGLGHYDNTKMPGQVGNFALAGHRNGYGQPLGDVDKLQPGDPIIIRTKDYWYVYKYTNYEIVKPEEVRVISDDPQNTGTPTTKRLITMTTCEPKYSAPIYRWISYGEFSYWAKVSDGIPKELSSTDSSGRVQFINNEQPSPIAQLDSLVPVMLVALLAYAVIFIAALVAWRFPVLRAIRSGERRRPEVSAYGWLLRHQPGVLPVRLVLLGLLLFVVAAALFEWGFPWAASTIPVLREMSNFTAVPTA